MPPIAASKRSSRWEFGGELHAGFEDRGGAKVGIKSIVSSGIRGSRSHGSPCGSREAKNAQFLLIAPPSVAFRDYGSVVTACVAGITPGRASVRSRIKMGI